VVASTQVLLLWLPVLDPARSEPTYWRQFLQKIHEDKALTTEVECLSRAQRTAMVGLGPPVQDCSAPNQVLAGRFLARVASPPIVSEPEASDQATSGPVWDSARATSRSRRCSVERGSPSMSATWRTE